MKIPQFLYVPRVNTLGYEKIIIETRNNIYWQVFDFFDIAERTQWLEDHQEEMIDRSLITANIHKKYPVLLLCFFCGTEMKATELIKIGNRACDWYIQFYLRNKQLSKPQFREKEESKKAKEYFKHWVWGDNVLSNPDLLYLINLEYGMMVKFNHFNTVWATFEEFEQDIADVQFLSGHIPDADTVEKLTIDAWNFLGICERINEKENFSGDDIFDNVFID